MSLSSSSTSCGALISTARSSLVLSICFFLTLGQISNISVIALPVYTSELSYPDSYIEARNFGSVVGFEDSFLTSDTLNQGPIYAKPPRSRRLAPRWMDLNRDISRTRSTMAVPEAVFGVALATSIRYANVAISLCDDAGASYIYIYVPVVVARCGISLKGKGECLFPQSRRTCIVREIQV